MIWLKSIGVVILGFVVVGGLHVLTDFVLEKSGAFPPPGSAEALGAGYLATAAVYRSIYNVFGGWLTARLAPRAPVGHAIALGLLGAAAATAGTIAMWHLGAHWYPIALAVLALPSCWLGGWIAAKHPDARAAA
jgi:hypothetical protein